MAIKDIKYMEDSIATKKTLVLAKKPIKGGKPAKDSKTKDNIMANTLLDLNNEANSVKSLFVLFLNLYFNLVSKKIDQIKAPANI